MRPLYVGIDLGTTNSAAAVFDGEQVILVRERGGSALTPSVVRIDARGAVTVGHKARRFLETDPRNTRAEFKRLMGTAAPLDFPAAKVQKRPEELAAEVLRSLRADVKEQLGVLPERAVISVPALFELPQSAATGEAAALAGFTKIELIQEPIASALAAGWTAAEEAGYWLVYDLGGGTFDASLLETCDGHLRVVGHDGDNFLGGRDFDLAIVDLALAELSRQSHSTISRADPQHAAGLRKLKLAAEEAKIELTRQAQTPLQVPEAFTIGEQVLDVDLLLSASQLSALALPLIDRSLDVCRRLLAAHSVESRALRRIVLVGGPTVMPVLRRRLAEALGAPLSEGLDPMTLVAQGAALFAATAGLDARPARPPQAGAHKLWLQYPAMSSDLTPHVVGRLLPTPGSVAPTRLRLDRADGLWQSPVAAIDPEGGFVAQVELLARRSNVFRVVGLDDAGAEVPVDPPTLTIVQGLTISDPPLSRSIGVALASDRVHSYFERGTPLPARRTFVHHTVETVTAGAAPHGKSDGEVFALKIPIVQGEYEHAHLCRLVGTLLIRGDELRESLPAGAALELSLQVDRGGQLFARALTPGGQVFEHVAHLIVPEAVPAVLVASAAAVADRLAAARTEAFRLRQPKLLDRLQAAEQALREAQRDVQAAQGGDADAGQKARRSLLELDALLEEIDAERRWPELCGEARRVLAGAASWVSQQGTAAEQSLLSEVTAAAQAAVSARQITELQRQLRVARELSSAAYYRHPDAWRWVFESAAAEAESASDMVKAQALVRDGRQVIAAGDLTRLRGIVEQLWKLLPADAESRRQSFESGVR